MSWKVLQDRSYTPYSGKPVSCIVEGTGGQFYAGVRIENISFPLTITAVQAACSVCLSEGDIPARIYVPHEKLDQLSFWVKEFELEVIQTEQPPVEELTSLKQSMPREQDSLPRLKELLKQAVTPNSDFAVSALLFTEDGTFEGVNVEVSEWSKGLCAERVALCKALADGVTEYTRMEVHTRKGEISSPCGACRQVLTELLPFHPVILHHSDDTRSEHLTVDLMPFSFKSSALKQ